MNGFGFDSAAQFFGESAFDDGFSNTDSNGFGGSFFTESGDFSGNGFGDSSFIGESVGYTGGMSQFGSVFSESAFGEDGFSTVGMFCEGFESVEEAKKFKEMKKKSEDAKYADNPHAAGKRLAGNHGTNYMDPSQVRDDVDSVLSDSDFSKKLNPGQNDPSAPKLIKHASRIGYDTSDLTKDQEAFRSNVNKQFKIAGRRAAAGEKYKGDRNKKSVFEFFTDEE